MLDEFELRLTEPRLFVGSHCETAVYYINWIFPCHAPDQPLQIDGCFKGKQKLILTVRIGAVSRLSGLGRALR
jgi:hypothetical protein